MRKLSITLLLIASSFMGIEANTSATNKSSNIELKEWDNIKRMPVFIPINITLIDNHIEVLFFQDPVNQVTFQVKDKYGNILFQEMVIPSKREIYKINLDGFKAGEYELVYIEDETTYIGDFQVD